MPALSALPSGGCRYVDGWPPGCRGNLHGQLADRLQPAGEHTRDRGGALLAGHERLHERGGAAVDLAEGVGAPGDDHHDHGRPGGQQLGQQLGLDAGQPQVLDVAALAGRAVPEQPREVADQRDAQVGPLGGGGRGGEAGPVLALDGAAGLVHHLDARQLGPQRLDRAHHLQAEPGLRVAGQDVVGERVAAHQRADVGRARPDHRHLPQRRATLAEQRQGRPLVEQHDRPLGQLPGDRAVGGGVEVDRLSARHRGLGGPLSVEQTELDLLRQQAAEGPVDEAFRHLAPPDLLDQPGVADGVGQLDVDARFERLGRGVGRVSGHAVHGGQERHRPVVGHDRALEPPLAAQHFGEQPRVGTGRNTVDVGVGVHHRADPGEGDRGLERRQHDVHQLAAAHRDRPVVAGGPGRGVPGEVLECRDHTGALQAAHVGAAEHGDQVGVLTDGLLDPAPPVVAHDVDHRGEAVVHAHGGHVAPDRGGHPLDELRVEGGAPRDRRGVDRRPVGGEPGEALLVDDRGHAQSRAVDHGPLLAHHLGGAFRGGDGSAAEDPGEVADAVLGRLGERCRAARGEDVLHRRDVQRFGIGFGRPCVGGPHVVADPPAAELGDLLLQRHLPQQEFDPLGDGQARVLPRQAAQGGGGRVGCRHGAVSSVQRCLGYSKCFDGGDVGCRSGSYRSIGATPQRIYHDLAALGLFYSCILTPQCSKSYVDVPSAGRNSYEVAGVMHDWQAHPDDPPRRACRGFVYGDQRGLHDDVASYLPPLRPQRPADRFSARRVRHRQVPARRAEAGEGPRARPTGTSRASPPKASAPTRSTPSTRPTRIARSLERPSRTTLTRPASARPSARARRPRSSGAGAAARCAATSRPVRSRT